MQYDNTNRGIIAKNDRKEKDTHPDIKGSINVEGVEYWLDGWIKERNDGSGKFYSLSVKPKERQAAPAYKAPSQDGAKARQLAPRQAPRPSSGFDDMDSDLPPF
jgi:hypothetical protein